MVSWSPRGIMVDLVVLVAVVLVVLVVVVVLVVMMLCHCRGNYAGII